MSVEWQGVSLIFAKSCIFITSEVYSKKIRMRHLGILFTFISYIRQVGLIRLQSSFSLHTLKPSHSGVTEGNVHFAGECESAVRWTTSRFQWLTLAALYAN